MNKRLFVNPFGNKGISYEKPSEGFIFNELLNKVIPTKSKYRDTTGNNEYPYNDFMNTSINKVKPGDPRMDCKYLLECGHFGSKTYSCQALCGLFCMYEDCWRYEKGDQNGK